MKKLSKYLIILTALFTTLLSGCSSGPIEVDTSEAKKFVYKRSAQVSKDEVFNNITDEIVHQTISGGKTNSTVKFTFNDKIHRNRLMFAGEFIHPTPENIYDVNSWFAVDVFTLSAKQTSPDNRVVLGYVHYEDLKHGVETNPDNFDINMIDGIYRSSEIVSDVRKNFANGYAIGAAQGNKNEIEFNFEHDSEEQLEEMIEGVKYNFYLALNSLDFELIENYTYDFSSFREPSGIPANIPEVRGVILR